MNNSRRDFLKKSLIGLAAAAFPTTAASIIEEAFDKQFPEGIVIFEVKELDRWARVQEAFRFQGKEFWFSCWVKTNVPGKYTVSLQDERLQFHIPHDKKIPEAAPEASLNVQMAQPMLGEGKPFTEKKNG